MSNEKSKKTKWSQKVTEQSHALELESGVFTWKNSQKIAQSLLQSALESTQHKVTPYQSAMSMLNFYINRAGKKLDPQQKAILLKAKEELHAIAQKTRKSNASNKSK